MELTTKVVAYVVHDQRLLVFTHGEDHEPVYESGLQVPAGSCAPGEHPDVAVVREVQEETGLAVMIDRFLGITTYDMRPYADTLQERHFYALRLCGTQPPVTWQHIEGHDASGATHTFNCSWLPINRSHVLAAGQGALLGTLAEHLGL